MRAQDRRGQVPLNPWPYWDSMTAPEEQQTDNFNTVGSSKSGLCGGGGATRCRCRCRFVPQLRPDTGCCDQNYCCNDAARAAGEETVRQDHGRARPSPCPARCELRRLLQRPRASAAGRLRRVRPHSWPPPPGGYDPYGYGGMYYYEDKQRYRYRSCNQCGDTNAKDHNGMERPGMCTSCGGDERLLIGDPKEESTYWDAGVCAPKCAEGEYFEGGMFECMAKSKAGEYCWSHYQWDPITGEASDIGGFMCASGVCGSTVKDPFFHMGYMMGNEYCCNADAVKEDNGQCCGRCKQGSGECLEWETCPAPPSEDMSAAQAAAGTIINSIKDEKQKKKAETLTAAAIAGEISTNSRASSRIHRATPRSNVLQERGHRREARRGVATSLGGRNQPTSEAEEIAAQDEFEVEVFFTETEVKDNSIGLRTASTNLELPASKA